MKQFKCQAAVLLCSLVLKMRGTTFPIAKSSPILYSYLMMVLIRCHHLDSVTVTLFVFLYLIWQIVKLARRAGLSAIKVKTSCCVRTGVCRATKSGQCFNKLQLRTLPFSSKSNCEGYLCRKWNNQRQTFSLKLKWCCHHRNTKIRTKHNSHQNNEGDSFKKKSLRDFSLLGLIVNR